MAVIGFITTYALCDKVCQRLATGQWFSLVSSTNKTDRHDILLKVALKTLTLTPTIHLPVAFYGSIDSMISYLLLNNFKASNANKITLRINRTKIFIISGTVLLIFLNARLI